MLNMSMPSLSNKSNKYTLDQVNAILFAGFDYTIPEESINILNLCVAKKLC